MEKTKNKKMSSLTKLIIALVVIVIGLIAAEGMFVVTYPDEYNVVMQFGQIVRVIDTEGVSTKVPFIQSVRSITKKTRLYDIPISEVLTKDKKSMVVDCFVLWKVTDPEKFIRNLSGSVENAEVRIGNISYNTMKNVISTLDQQEMISGRDTLADSIFNNVGTSLESYGVEMVDFGTKRNDLPDANKSAVYTRMISERNNIAAKYMAEGHEEAQKIHNDTNMQVNISLSNAHAEAALIEAQGESEYMRILAEAYGSPEKAEFYNFIRALEMAKESLSGGNDTLILDKDSPITQLFYDLD